PHHGYRDRPSDDDLRPAMPEPVRRILPLDDALRHHPQPVDPVAEHPQQLGSSVIDVSSETAGISMHPIPIDLITGIGRPTNERRNCTNSETDVTYVRR